MLPMPSSDVPGARVQEGRAVSLVAWLTTCRCFFSIQCPKKQEPHPPVGDLRVAARQFARVRDRDSAGASKASDADVSPAATSSDEAEQRDQSSLQAQE